MVLSLSDSEHPYLSVTLVGAKDVRQIASLLLTFSGQGPDILKITRNPSAEKHTSYFPQRKH